MNSNTASFFNIVDYVYICVMLASSLFGLANGFTRTLLSLSVWVGSGFAAGAITPYVYQFFENYISDPMAAQLVASSSSYILCLILLMVLSYFVSDAVKRSIFAGLDRALGLLFGLIRGLCVPTGIIAVFLAFGIPKEKFTMIDKSRISTFLYRALKGIVPKIEIPILKDNQKKDNYPKKYYKRSLNYRANERRADQEAKKAATFKISQPKHNGLGQKIIDTKKVEWH